MLKQAALPDDCRQAIAEAVVDRLMTEGAPNDEFHEFSGGDAYLESMLREGCLTGGSSKSAADFFESVSRRLKVIAGDNADHSWMVAHFIERIRDGRFDRTWFSIRHK